MIGRKTGMVVLSVLGAVSLSAGTLIYRGDKKGESEQVVSDVKIISINRAKNEITIEIGKGRKTLALSRVNKYYDTEISSGGAFQDDTPEYGVSIIDVEMPRRSTEVVRKKKNGSVSTSKVVSEAEVEYSVSSNGQTVKMPYFYLFVLTTHENEYGSRPVYLFSYPDKAKVKTRGSSKDGAVYDEAQMLEKVLGFERPNLHEANHSRMGSSPRMTSLGRRKVAFKMSGMKAGQKIIAYHLIVWGKKKIAAVKDWKDPAYSIGDRWWERR